MIESDHHCLELQVGRGPNFVAELPHVETAVLNHSAPACHREHTNCIAPRLTE